MKYSFKVLKPEPGMNRVPSIQQVQFLSEEGHLIVWVYFMINQAVTITKSEVHAGFGKVKLTCVCGSASGAYTASVNLRKVEFRFFEPQGMSNQFVFSTRAE